jgi:hypothetical protein
MRSRTVGSYAVYCRCRSAVRLPAGRAVRFQRSGGRLPSVEVRSRYPPAPVAELARDLVIEVRVEAASLQDAVNEGLQAAGSQLLALTVAANAFAANPVLVSAYETGADLVEREWLQRRQPAEEAVPPNSREIAAEPAGEFMRAAEHHPQRRRFGRVLAFYREALRYAETDSALLAVEFLHVAAETLTPVLLKRDRGKEKPADEELRRVRLEQIYSGDSDLRRRVERLSNGFEHGFADLGSAKDTAQAIVGDASWSIRNAIVRASGVPPAVLAELLSERFSVPMPLFDTEYLYMGKLRVADDERLAPGSEPVEALRDWAVWPESAERRGDGSLLVRTAASARASEQGTTVTVEAVVQRLPVGLPAGARMPEHRITSIDVVDEQE